VRFAARGRAADDELARLGLDLALADPVAAVAEGQDAGCHAWRSSPSLSKDAARIRFSPAGTSSAATTSCSMIPTKP
jgi:hypothetical protein